MIRRASAVSLLLAMAALGARVLSAQCEGSASPATTYTQHLNCSEPRNALQWTLSIACVDACGKVWRSLTPRDGSADGACDQLIRNFCSPEWYRYNYSNGQYGETSAFSAFLFGGCQLSEVPVTTAGDCPCAPSCEPDEGGDDNECGPPSKRAPLRPKVDNCGGGTSPILIDLGSAGFRLTDLEGGVVFDLDGDGDFERVSWTQADSGEVFLALDRDGNGTVDGGHELFGDATQQPVTDNPNGYNALATFDLDGDGRITSADPVYSDLLLWEDLNHDGASQPDELRTTAERGVVAIDLNYKESRARDRHGNSFRYRSVVYLTEEDGRLRRTRSIDVFLLVEN